jgi:hypothetical protein
MKYCPICDERYDEEIIKFCTKDGTPLVDDEQPNFTALPSENVEEPGDDFGEETIIRRKPANAAGTGSFGSPDSERIVIPTSQAREQEVRPRAQVYYPPPTPNTAKTIVLTILGTLVVLGFGAGLFWFLQKEKPANIFANINANANQNTNLNTNLGFDSNFNFNTTGNFNASYSNLNANLKTPTPSPTPKPSPSVTPSPTPAESPSPSPTPRQTPSIRPSPSPTPRMGPRPNSNTNL